LVVGKLKTTISRSREKIDGGFVILGGVKT